MWFALSLRGNFSRNCYENTFSRIESEAANEHIDKVLEIVNLFHEPDVNENQLMLRIFPMTLTGQAYRWFKTIPFGSITTCNNLKTRRKIGDKSEGLAAITSQLSSLGRKMNKLFEHVHSKRVSCELCNGSLLSNDFPNKEKVKGAEEIYYGEFYQRPYPNRGRYIANSPWYYVKEENKIGYQEKRPSFQERLDMITTESATRDKGNTNMIMEIQYDTQTSLRSRDAILKSMEI
ncbi:hypothetical protein Tco_0298681 [Tanacetum coccineum]